MDCIILVMHMENLCHEFDSRFQDYGHIEPVVTFFLKPFNNTASPSATAVTISDVFGDPLGKDQGSAFKGSDIRIPFLVFCRRLKIPSHSRHCSPIKLFLWFNLSL